MALARDLEPTLRAGLGKQWRDLKRGWRSRRDGLGPGERRGPLGRGARPARPDAAPPSGPPTGGSPPTEGSAGPDAWRARSASCARAGRDGRSGRHLPAGDGQADPSAASRVHPRVGGDSADRAARRDALDRRLGIRRTRPPGRQLPGHVRLDRPLGRVHGRGHRQGVRHLRHGHRRGRGGGHDVHRRAGGPQRPGRARRPRRPRRGPGQGSGRPPGPGADRDHAWARPVRARVRGAGGLPGHHAGARRDHRRVPGLLLRQHDPGRRDREPRQGRALRRTGSV